MKILPVVVILAALLCPRTAAAASDQWIELRGPHFTVLSAIGEREARHTLDQFERMRWVFQTLFRNVNVDPPEPILVVLVRNTRAFQGFEPAAYLERGQLNLAGYFLKTPDRNYILLRLDGEQENHPFSTVYHEYTHLQFARAGEWLPVWLNEGLAEFFQNTDIHDRNVELGRPSTEDLLYLRQERLIPLPVLFKVDSSSPYYHEEQKGSIFYAESWALTHLLMVRDRQAGTTHVFDYMQLLSRRQDPLEAAQTVFGDLRQLERDLNSYVHMGDYKEFLLNSASAPIDQSSYTSRPLPPAGAEAVRADVLAGVRREQDARALIDAILREDPGNVQARETLGGIELRSGNREAARRWYGEAVKLDSESYLANYYYAAITFEEQGSQNDAVESSLRTAIRLNPRFAPSYDLLARCLLRGGPGSLEEAHRTELMAVQLDPGNVHYRLNAASILVQGHRYQDARTVLVAARNLARNPGEAAMVESRIGDLDRFEQATLDRERARREAPRVQAGDPAEGPIKVITTLRHPSEASGPKHSAVGVIHGVRCSYPAAIEFELQAPGRSLSLYNNDFSTINLTAAGFQPPASMNPCRDFEGISARVQYAESDDRSVAGKATAIELRR